MVVLMIIKVILATCKEFTGREQEEKQGGYVEDCDRPLPRSRSLDDSRDGRCTEAGEYGVHLRVDCSFLGGGTWRGKREHV